MIVPPLAGATIDPLLDCTSGLLLSGGPDLHPSAYGEEPDPQLGPTWPELDSIELSITREALDRGMPILAVCRGLQLLNVARGGTLVQHLPDRVGERVHHRQEVPGGRTTHWVRIGRGSQLASILDRTRTTVNSFHHQAVDRLGEGLVPTAWASDGTIEGLEDRRVRSSSPCSGTPSRWSTAARTPRCSPRSSRPPRATPRSVTRRRPSPPSA